MNLESQSVKWLGCEPDGVQMLSNLATAGRTCYRSEIGATKTTDSDAEFVRRIIKRGHESVLEHEKLSVILRTNRAIANELVRHRHCAFSQESTRYCNYSREDKFGGELTFIQPPWTDRIHVHEMRLEFNGKIRLLHSCNSQDPATDLWCKDCLRVEDDYMMLLTDGWTPEKARGVLNNDLATTLVMSANIREWRSVMRLRLSSFAHPQIRELMRMTVEMFNKAVPVLFEEFV